MIATGPKTVFLPAAKARGHQPDFRVEVDRGDRSGLEHQLLGCRHRVRPQLRIGERECFRERLVETRMAPVWIIFRGTRNKVRQELGCVGDVGNRRDESDIIVAGRERAQMDARFTNRD